MRLTRNYAGMQDVGALPDSDLIDAINDFYRYTLPNEATFDELVSSFTLLVEPGQSTYTFPKEIICLTNPRLLDEQVNLFNDINFFDRISELQGMPERVMVLNGNLFFNPTPNSEYRAQFAAYTRPTALKLLTDLPFRDDIDDLLGVGTAKLLLNRQGDIDRATALQAQYNFLRSNAMAGTYRAKLGSRCSPRF